MKYEIPDMSQCSVKVRAELYYEIILVVFQTVN